MKHPWRVFFAGAGSASADNRSLPAEDLGLNEQIAKGRMQRVRGRRCDNHFRITRDVDRSARPGAVGQGDPAQFDVVLGRNRDLRVRDIVVVPAAKLGAAFRENRFVILRGLSVGWYAVDQNSPLVTSRR